MSQAEPLARKTVIAGGLWLAAWAALFAWLAFELATKWPYVGSPLELIMLFAAAGVLFRGFDLAWLWRRRVQVKGWRRWLARGVAFVAGGFAAASVWQVLDAASMSRFSAAIAPFVKAVQANAAAPCPPAAQYAPDAALREYLVSSGFPSPRATIHHDGKRLVLSFPGGSADIDGSTLWYDAGAPGWNKFHNDNRERADAFGALVKGMQECRFPLSPGSQP